MVQLCGHGSCSPFQLDRCPSWPMLVLTVEQYSWTSAREDAVWPNLPPLSLMALQSNISGTSPTALTQDRYTWRLGSILVHIIDILRFHLPDGSALTLQQLPTWTLSSSRTKLSNCWNTQYQRTQWITSQMPRSEKILVKQHFPCKWSWECRLLGSFIMEQSQPSKPSSLKISFELGRS